MRWIYSYGVSNSTGTWTQELSAKSDTQALSMLLETCSSTETFPVFLIRKEDKKVIWEDREYIKRKKLEEASIAPFNKGDEIEFDWKVAGNSYQVTGVVEKVYIDKKSINPAQKYFYQIRLTKPLTMTMNPGRRVTVKRISMKNIQKLY